MKWHALLCAVVAASVVYVVPFFGIAAMVPNEIAFQGRLLDEEGVPIPEGTKQMYFQIYDAETGGTAFWSENQTVTVGPDGFYTAYLGRKSPLQFPFDQAYWLQVKVGDDSPMTPRFPFKRVPYAFRAALVDQHNHFGSSWFGTGETGLIVSTSHASGKAIRGRATSTSGETYGGYFESQSTNGTGVYGEAPYEGVWGLATLPAGYTSGGFFKAESEQGRGVVGWASATSGYALGGLFQSDSTSGRGVYGYAYATTGATYGGYFLSDSTSGKAVYGRTSAGSGDTCGGYFETESTTGRGVYGYADASTGVNYGGYFETDSSSGRGVYGLASNSAGVSYGGYFEGRGASGAGAYCHASAISGTTVGVYGAVSSPGGYAGFFQGGNGVHVVGNLSCTGTKPFVQEHPNDPTKEIVYAAIEGPEAGTYIAGSAEVRDGLAEIELPEHFALVTCEEGLRVHLTPVGEWLQLYVAAKTPGRVTVREASGKSGQFDYLIQGVRRGYEDYPAVRERKTLPKPGEAE